MKDQEVPNQLPADFDEQIILNTALPPVAAEMSKSLDTFASWALGGFAAALALLISNNDAHKWIGQENFSVSGKTFAVVLVLTTVQKYVSVILTGLAFAGPAGAKAALDQAATRGQSFRFNPETMLHLLSSTLWLLPKFVRKRLGGRLRAGDYMGNARSAMKLLQLQALLVLLIAVALLVAACSMAWH